MSIAHGGYFRCLLQIAAQLVFQPVHHRMLMAYL
jgi:hypothetical protein